MGGWAVRVRQPGRASRSEPPHGPRCSVALGCIALLALHCVACVASVALRCTHCVALHALRCVALCCMRCIAMQGGGAGCNAMQRNATLPSGLGCSRPATPDPRPEVVPSAVPRTSPGNSPARRRAGLFLVRVSARGRRRGWLGKAYPGWPAAATGGHRRGKTGSAREARELENSRKHFDGQAASAVVRHGPLEANSRATPPSRTAPSSSFPHLTWNRPCCRCAESDPRTRLLPRTPDPSWTPGWPGRRADPTWSRPCCR
jgi:hypothetical protein